MTVGILSNFKSVFRVRIPHLAFSLPKAHSTGFLALRSKLLRATSALLEHVSYSFKCCQSVGWNNNAIWNRSHARQNTLVKLLQLRILQFSVYTRIGKHFCTMHNSRASAFYIQKYATVIADSLNIKRVKRFIVVIVLRICSWSHYWDVCTVYSTKCLNHLKLCFKLSNFHFHFLLITRKVDI